MTACGNKDTNAYQSYYDENLANSFDTSWSFTSERIDSIPLDNKTAFYTYSLQYIDFQNDSALLTFTNGNSNIKKNYNSIYIYNYDSKQLKNVLTFNADKGNVGSLAPPSAHLFINEDSIYIYNTNRLKLYLCDKSCVIIDSITTVNRKIDQYGAHPEPSTSNPIIKAESSILIPSSLRGFRKSYDQYKTILKIDSGISKYVIDLPESYNKAFWGERFKYLVSLCYNPNTQKIILSYPIDPFLYEATVEGDVVNKYYAGSSFFGPISSMTNDVSYGTKGNQDSNDPDREYYSFTNSEFNRIMYDKYRNLYYRVTLIRSKKNEQPDNYMPDLSIIVLDSNFKKVSEKRFDGHIYHPTMLFVSKEGLNIARQDLYRRNNNYLYFNLFKISNL